MTKPNFKLEHKFKVRCGICNIDIPNWREHVMSEKHRAHANQLIPEIEETFKRFNQLDEEKPKIQCSHCSWVGVSDDLHLGTLEDQTCYCPKCGGEIETPDDIDNADFADRSLEEEEELENEEGSE